MLPNKTHTKKDFGNTGLGNRGEGVVGLSENTQKEFPGNEENKGTYPDPRDVKFVVSQTGCTEAQARSALEMWNGDLFEAVLSFDSSW